MQIKMKNLNSPKTIKEIDIINLSKRKFSDGFTVEVYQISKKEIAIFASFFKTQRRLMLPNMFYEASKI